MTSPPGLLIYKNISKKNLGAGPDITDQFVLPSDENYDEALEGKQVFITNNLENKTCLLYTSAAAAE